jgi:chloramphenicol O-acetyltransferase type B
MQWWDWSDDQLKGAMAILTSGDTAALYHYWQSAVHGK